MILYQIVAVGPDWLTGNSKIRVHSRKVYRSEAEAVKDYESFSTKCTTEFKGFTALATVENLHLVQLELEDLKQDDDWPDSTIKYLEEHESYGD